MKAICDTATSEVLFCQEDEGELPSGRVAVVLDTVTAEYATKGYPLVWDGDETVVADMAYMKTQVRARVKHLRETTEAGGCTVAGVGRFDTDDSSKLKIVGAVVAAGMIGSGFTIEWRLADNSVTTLNATQMATVGLTVSNHVSLAQNRKNVLDAEIDAATTIAELLAIDTESGWPS